MAKIGFSGNFAAWFLHENAVFRLFYGLFHLDQVVSYQKSPRNPRNSKIYFLGLSSPFVLIWIIVPSNPSENSKKRFLFKEKTTCDLRQDEVWIQFLFLLQTWLNSSSQYTYMYVHENITSKLSVKKAQRLNSLHLGHSSPCIQNSKYYTHM